MDDLPTLGAAVSLFINQSGASAVRRGYVWEIVHSDMKGNISVERTSTRSFRTMEDAYSNGAAALARLPKPRPINSGPTR
jgi:hypothetical protein